MKETHKAIVKKMFDIGKTLKHQETENHSILGQT